MTKKIFIFLIFSVLLISFYFIQVIMKYPYIGIEVEQNENGQIEIIRVNPNGVGKSLNIQEKDIILSVDKGNPEKYTTIEKYNLVEKTSEIVIQRKENIYNYEFPPFNNNEQLIFHLVFPLLFLSIAFLSSMFLFFYHNHEKIIFVLIILLQLHGISTLSGAASSRTDSLAQFVSSGALLLLPLLLIHFFFSYFQRFNIQLINYKTLKVFYKANLTVLFFSVIFLNIPWSSTLYLISKSLILVMFVVNVLSCVYFFGSSFIKNRKSVYSPLFKIINAGIIISFSPFVFLYALPSIFINKEFISGEVAFLFTFFLPLTFVYLVSTNRFLDINFYIKRIYYYAILSLIPSLLLVIAGSTLIHDIPVLKWVQIFVVVYLFFIFVFYIKEEIDYRFRSNLFSEKYNMQSSIYGFVSFLSLEKNKKVIEQYFVNEIKSVLGLKNIALLEYEKEIENLNLIHGDKWDYEMKLLLEHLSQYNGKYFFGELQAINSDLYLIIAENAKNILVLVFGEKSNFTAFNMDEKEWLKTISYYMNVSYQNLQMIEDLIEELEKIKIKDNAPSWVLKMLFNIEEKERKRLSIDLHDSALQEQLLLYRKLSAVLEKNNLEPLVKQELTAINEGLLDVIHEIRETCNELMPPFLKETGIVGALENLFKKVQLRTNLVIDFVVDRNFTFYLNDETTLILYRVIQELINNAEKHSNASRVDFILSYEKDQVTLDYKDDGEGLLENKVSAFNGRLGIYGIKERVRSINGTIEFENLKYDSGLQILIEIPLNNESQILRGQ